MKNKYVVVTAISTFRQRYVVPLDELQALNPDMEVDQRWAVDCVTMEEVKEFSQKHLGEQIVDCVVLNEKKTLELFNEDNDYLSSWGLDQKIRYIRDWKEKCL